MYVDANNLYGWALSKLLPDVENKWMSDDECLEAFGAFQDKAFCDRWFDEHEKQYYFEVDVDYLSELHDRDDDYQLAPETKTIEVVMTSEKQHEPRAMYFGAASPFSRKLVCSFLAKRKYVRQGYNLRFDLDRGMKLVIIHRGISCTASPYFEPYITNNNNKRKQCKNDEVLQNFYKLMNNSVYGQTIENVAKRSEVKLVTDEIVARRLSEKPHCVDFRLFGNYLIGFEMRKLRHVINKPFQIGFSVLEWSKLKIAQFYALLKDAFGDKVRMLYTDTDSFFLQFFVDDLAKEINARPQVRDAFDFSEISPGHISKLARSNAQLHAGEVGYFKDECKNDPIVEFV